MRGYSLCESCRVNVAKAKTDLRLYPDAMRFSSIRLLLFLLSCLLRLLCLLRFLGHVALRDPQSWLIASRHSTCKQSDYTTISKLKFLASNKVNERHIFATTATGLGLSVQQTPLVGSRWVNEI
jgi:hypothetical protein